ncbi:MAG TPA: hypothetical protein VFN78_14600 [Ktedonobacterales bacterium]|nr:hypothetical protein [Ktedonobacterales bacterium]
MIDRSAAGRAAWVMTIHTGGCSACAQSLAALEAPRYARRLNALGVTLMRSPRHSDVILLCGALTERARAGVSALLDGTPHPRAVVAVGDCAINGCVFAGAPGLTTPLAQTFNANVVIGGCPPSPLAIIDAIAEARRLLGGQPATTAGAASADEDASGMAPTLAEPTAEAPADGPTPGRATRLASLFEAAGESWVDDDEDDEDDEDMGERDDAPGLHDRSPDLAREEEHDHLNGSGNGAAMPGSRHHKEKRR